MIQDTYILQKDLPDGSKAGDCYKQSSNRYYNVRLKQLAVGYDESLLLEIYQVENNPEWFKKEESTVAQKAATWLLMDASPLPDFIQIADTIYEPRKNNL